MSLILVDRYQIVESWGKNDTGETFLGIDLHTPSRKQVVIKSLEAPVANADPEILAQLFAKEQRLFFLQYAFTCFLNLIERKCTFFFWMRI